MVFIDLEKAYDRVLSKILWRLWKRKGICIANIHAIKYMYDKATTSIKAHGGMTKDSLIKIDVHQRSSLSLYLFTIVLDVLSKHI